MILRLQKLMAERGIASRRQSEKMIVAGQVKVNGVKVTELGTKVDTLQDLVSVKGAVISNPRKKKENRYADEGEVGTQKVPERSDERFYLMLHKPVGYVTTAHDEMGRKTIMDLLGEAKKTYGRRLFAVGRLDVDTSGLLLITNDGDWANRVVHPRYEVVKTYVAVTAGGEWTANEVDKFTTGIRLGSRAKKLTAPAEWRMLERRSDGTRKVEIKIAEGQNHQVRRMCAAVNHRVLRLERVAIGKLNLGELKKAKWRALSEHEVEQVTSQ